MENRVIIKVFVNDGYWTEEFLAFVMTNVETNSDSCVYLSNLEFRDIELPSWYKKYSKNNQISISKSYENQKTVDVDVQLHILIWKFYTVLSEHHVYTRDFFLFMLCNLYNLVGEPYGCSKVTWTLPLKVLQLKTRNIQLLNSVIYCPIT